MLSEKEKFISIIILQISSLFFVIGFKELGWINDVAKSSVYEYKKSEPISTEVINESKVIDPEIVDADYITPNLVGWWKFDESENSIVVNDSSGNDLQGEISGKGRWLSEGECIHKGCLDLQGTTGIDFTIKTPLPQYSFSGWIKKTVDTSREAQIFATNGDNAGVTIYEDQRILFFDHSILKSSSMTEPGIFYHVVVTNDGENKMIYINGKLEASGEAVSNLRLCLGSHGTSRCLEDGISNGITPGWARFGSLGMNARNLNAVIDDFRIYDGALSPKDINKLYNEAGQ